MLDEIMIKFKPFQSPRESFSTKVPIHSLGMSQIIAYGLLFYLFALVKAPLAKAYGISEIHILSVLSVIVGMQAFLGPVFGYWADRLSALTVMVFGLLSGGVGLAFLSFGGELIWIYIGFIFIALGIGGATYELAFTAAVQLDEAKSRKNISYITFYGAVASSLTWLLVGPMLETFGLSVMLMLLCFTVWLMAFRLAWLTKKTTSQTPKLKNVISRFRWSELKKSEKIAMVLLGLSGGAGYLGFSAAAMMWITWFDNLYASAAFAVILASIYGPFQLVGRLMEMIFGSGVDARLTGAISSLLVPISLFMAQFENGIISIIAMALFGMGHGVTTVTHGFVTNLYFRAEVYGRAKGWISLPKTLGLAFGPLVGGLLYHTLGIYFLWSIIALSLLASLSLWAILSQQPTNQVHLS